MNKQAAWQIPKSPYLATRLHRNRDGIATFQMGTHPLLTSSPVAHQVVNAAEMALKRMRE